MTAWNDHSLKVAMQSAFGTVNSTDGDYQALEAELPRVQFETEITELELMTGVVGAAPERVVGRRSGTLTFKMPLEGLVDGFDPTSEDPGGTPVGNEVIPMWFNLIANAMGSNNSAVSSNANFIRGLHCSVSQFTSGGMLSGTASSIVCDDATASNKVDVGQLVVAATSATTTTVQFGFVKTKATQTLTLFEAAANNVNDAAAHLYGTANAYVSTEITSTNPLTFRWTGPETEQCFELIDSICQKATVTWESNEVPTVEFEYKFYDFRINKQDGGLATPNDYERIPRIVGSFNGRATIDGTATCGLESCTWEWSATLRETKCHGANSGVSAVEVIKPRVRVRCSALYDTGDIIYDAAGAASSTTGQHRWQSALELGTTISLAFYVGTQVGKLFAGLIPAGKLVSVPQVELRENATVAYQLELEAGVYTGDSTDTAETTADSPIDSIARLALA